MNSNGEPSEAVIASTPGDFEIGDDLTVLGNLTVSGTTTTIETETLVIEDPLVKFGLGNAANLQDGGFIIEHIASGTKYSGIIRDKSDGNTFKIIEGLTAEPTLTTNNTNTYNNNLGKLTALNFRASDTNTVIGNASDIPSAGGIDNTAIGAFTASDITSGSQNTILGYSAGTGITTGSGNVLLGYNAEPSAVGADNELRIANALGNLISGDFSTGEVTVSGKIQSSNFGDTAGNNLFIGNINDPAPSTGIDNIAIGFGTGDNISTGSRNILLGFDTGKTIVASGENVAIGTIALGGGQLVTTSCATSVCIGSGCGQMLASGNSNTLVGGNNSASLSGGGFNTVIGGGAGATLGGGQRNVYLGYLADNGSDVNDTFILASNSQPLINGDFSTGAVNITGALTCGDVSSGTWNPTITFSTSGVMTETANVGKWDKIGKVYYYRVRIAWSGKGTPVGTASINLPFAPNSTDDADAQVNYHAGIGVSYGCLGTKIVGSTIQFYDVAISPTLMTDIYFIASAGSIELSGRFRIA